MIHTKFDKFKQLHTQDKPLVIYNCWDVGSALAIQQAGAQALATSSYAVAAAWGFSDGQQLPFPKFLWCLEQIAQNVTLPLSVDIEGGYATTLTELEENMTALFQLDICGINFEDQKVGTASSKLWTISQQSARIETIKNSAAKLNKEIFLNARTDLFFSGQPATNELVQQGLERTFAYQKAGADGIFVPGLTEKALLQEFAKQSPLPVNTMQTESLQLSPMKQVKLGVKRISYGPASYFTALQQLQKAAEVHLEID